MGCSKGTLNALKLAANKRNHRLQDGTNHSANKRTDGVRSHHSTSFNISDSSCGAILDTWYRLVAVRVADRVESASECTSDSCGRRVGVSAESG